MEFLEFLVGEAGEEEEGVDEEEDDSEDFEESSELGTWVKEVEKVGIGTSLSGWMCSKAEVRFLYFLNLHGVSTSIAPFSLRKYQY